MKKLFLCVIGLLTTITSFAQLTVVANDNDTNFIYVKDEVLFVTDDVSITKASGADADVKAGIYLRNDAQLLQGDGTTANSGTGFISVYQDSHSDAFDYNFWGSPVTSMDGANTFTLSSRVFNPGDSEITADASTFTGSWQGSGTSGIDYSGRAPLSISTAWLYTFDEGTQAWRYMGNSGTVAPGYGYTMKGTNITTGGAYNMDTNNQFYEFRGRPNNGDIQVALGTTSGAYTLAGNPYPSAIDLVAFFNDTDNDGISEIVYWDEDRTINSQYYVDNKGGYGTWVPGGSGLGDYAAPTFVGYDNVGNPIGGNYGTGEDLTRRYAPIAQGFMLKKGANGGSTVTFKNSHRDFVQEGSESIFRNPVERTHLRLHVIFDNYSHFRDLLLTFSDNATIDFDRGLDAQHPMDAGRQEAYFTTNGNDTTGEAPKNLVIESVPFYENLHVPISFKLEQQGRIRLKAAEELNVPYDKVFLLDSQDNMRYQILGDGPTITASGSVTAQLTLAPGTYEGRFYIVFEMEQEEDPRPITDARSMSNSVNMDFVQDNRAKVLEVYNPEAYKVNEANIYDMSGKLVYYAYALGEANYFSFPTYNFADGVYLVRMVTENNGVVSYKMSVNNR